MGVHPAAVNDERQHQGQLRLGVTVVEAAQLLGISRSLAYQLVERHELPAVRLGRRWVIPRRALDRLMDGEGGTDAHV